MKDVVLYVGHIYKPFWTQKIDRVGRGVKEGQNIAQNGPGFWLWNPLKAPKWVKEPGNGPQMIQPNAPDWFEGLIL